MFKYARYVSRVTRQPWALLPEKLAVITELIRERAEGHKLSDEEIVARLGDDRDRGAAMPKTGGSIAVIPIHGVIAHRADSFEASSGGTSTELIGRMLNKVAADDEVGTIVLDIDSPGGSVEGVPELASKIAKLATKKPVIAHVNALAASAAYWLASQASEIVATPSGMAGSIGVYLLLVDQSEALAKEGITVNAISAGDNKLEGAPWAPLSDESRAHFQSQVNDVYGQFLAAVAKGRKVSVATVRDEFGQGRVYHAKDALARGMVDRIATLEDMLGQMAAGKWKGGKRADVDAVTTIAADADVALESPTVDPVEVAAETPAPAIADGSKAAAVLATLID